MGKHIINKNIKYENLKEELGLIKIAWKNKKDVRKDNKK